MSAGHFGGNLLFRINFRAGFPRHSRLVSPRCYFSSIFCFLFVCSQDMTFSKQVLIKHFVSATERGPLSLKKVLTLFCDRRAQFWGIWQGLLHEEPQRKALYIYPFVKFFFFFAIHRFSCLHILASAASLGFYLHHIFSFLLREPSGVLSKSTLVWCLRPWCLCNIPPTTIKQTLLFPCTETSIYPDLDLAVIALTDGQSKAHHSLGAKKIN